MRIPRYDGRALVNLVAHLERMLTGDSPSPPLESDLGAAVPDADSVVMLLIDGLGHDMVVDLDPTSSLREALQGVLDASFSTQTSVATATLATGLPPSQHGLISYLLDLEETGGVVNTLWWMLTDGEPASVDLERFLPSPNVAERLATAGVTTTAVEPAGYLGTPLDAVLYRGATTRGVEDLTELGNSLIECAAPNSFVLGYIPHVDAAGHAEGPGSKAHREAIQQAAAVWERLAEDLPDDVLLVATADHGMVRAREWHQLEPPAGVRLGGDSRVLTIHGDEPAGAALAATLPGEIITRDRALPLWGPGPYHPAFESRLPNFLVAAPDGTVFHHPGDPMRLAGYHGGFTAAELEIPLLVR